MEDKHYQYHQGIIKRIFNNWVNGEEISISDKIKYYHAKYTLMLRGPYNARKEIKSINSYIEILNYNEEMKRALEETLN